MKSSVILFALCCLIFVLTAEASPPARKHVRLRVRVRNSSPRPRIRTLLYRYPSRSRSDPHPHIMRARRDVSDSDSSEWSVARNLAVVENQKYFKLTPEDMEQWRRIHAHPVPRNEA